MLPPPSIMSAMKDETEAMDTNKGSEKSEKYFKTSLCQYYLAVRERCLLAIGQSRSLVQFTSYVSGHVQEFGRRVSIRPRHERLEGRGRLESNFVIGRFCRWSKEQEDHALRKLSQGLCFCFAVSYSSNLNKLKGQCNDFSFSTKSSLLYTFNPRFVPISSASASTGRRATTRTVFGSCRRRWPTSARAVQTRPRRDPAALAVHCQPTPTTLRSRHRCAQRTWRVTFAPLRISAR